jgi:predicted DNA-binding antitoxin AbrB/MazE fold protein
MKGNDYFIIFVDPKGTEHTAAYRKVDGYKELFEGNGSEKVFAHDGAKVKIKLRLRPQDISKALAEYRQYWFDDIGKMLEEIARG